MIYYYIESDGSIHHTTNEGVTDDFSRIKIGNCFPTKEEAEFALERCKVYNALKGYMETHNNPEIKSGHLETSCCVYYLSYNFNVEKGNIFVEPYKAFGRGFADIYFTSVRIANEAIETIGEERILKYWFCID